MVPCLSHNTPPPLTCAYNALELRWSPGSSLLAVNSRGPCLSHSFHLSPGSHPPTCDFKTGQNKKWEKLPQCVHSWLNTLRPDHANMNPLSSPRLVRFGHKMTLVSKSIKCAKTGHMSNPCTVKLGLLEFMRALQVRRDKTWFSHLPFNCSKQMKPFQHSQLLTLKRKIWKKIQEVKFQKSQMQHILTYIFSLITAIHSLECFSGTAVEIHVNSSLMSHNLPVCKCKKKRQRRTG